MPSVAHLEPFNTSSGRKAGQKSAQVRQELLQNGHRYIEVAKEIAQIQADSRLSLDSEVQRQISLAEEQLERIRARLNDDDYSYCKHCERSGLADKDRASLVRELRGLMEHLCRLRGIGEPARVRPVNDPGQQRRAAMPRLAIEVPTVAQPLQAQPNPAQEPEPKQ